ncbi:G1/S regulator NimO, putative [Talaromyces stipitatus ATCC 10500]|uniref:G1/S regulator NimO, putative n=1 Tax=Talaromyces stipitatus (strain ATCC 10500 / CBS 375.48 / QM 6759 / NRRL 1006) TaxID=441959 RepID=B8LYM4_TALSN|nr:G1/S regulator NimO, putative [Talaromyces stipitatus ATCC 10500]EED23382.1 G1/S regulator NimO, putative [Talaromyces stipitatus ATCC 10500]
MAAIFVPPSPQTSFAMSSRRPPLANVPNAANSPHRSSNTAALKRARTGSEMGSRIDLLFGQPPAKKQFVEREDHATGSPSKPRSMAAPQMSAESRMFTRRGNASLTPFEKKLMAVREQKDGASQATRNSRYERASAEKLDNIRQWQRHYRKAFPSFVFYFDSLPADVRNRSLREVLALGAKEERFFSRTVTHVVTSRPIPDVDIPTPTETQNEQTSIEGPIQTVNPVLLERNDNRRDHGNNTDVLYRARQMGMKIWAIEKLQRMLAAIHEPDTSAAYTGGRAGSLSVKGRGETELSQVLRNERLHGPADRDPTQLMKDLVYFRGPFIYVHDMDEKTRPVMVREYPRVAVKEQGLWPQFRSAQIGKCPFIQEEPTKKELARMKEEKRRKQQQREQERTAAKEEVIKREDVPETQNQEQPVKQEADDLTAQVKLEEEDTAPLGPSDDLRPLSVRPAPPRVKSENHSVKPIGKIAAWPMLREPAASGVQPSNITSAIRSQMVSSTAAAPGAKAGLSKEVHELKRKVLEKSNGSMITSANPSSHRPMDAPTNMKLASGASAGAKRPREKMSNIHEEDTTQSEDNGNNNISQNTDCKGTLQKKVVKEKQRDPKPGYCENCRDKFDDFDEHTMTRKHRKFATTLSNWTELDALLSKLERPLKHAY